MLIVENVLNYCSVGGIIYSIVFIFISNSDFQIRLQYSYVFLHLIPYHLQAWFIHVISTVTSLQPLFKYLELFAHHTFRTSLAPQNFRVDKAKGTQHRKGHGNPLLSIQPLSTPLGLLDPYFGPTNDLFAVNKQKKGDNPELQTPFFIKD